MKYGIRLVSRTLVCQALRGATKLSFFKASKRATLSRSLHCFFFFTLFQLSACCWLHTIATLAKAAAAALGERGGGQERNLCRRGPRGPGAELQSQRPREARNVVALGTRRLAESGVLAARCKKGGKRNNKKTVVVKFLFFYPLSPRCNRPTWAGDGDGGGDCVQVDPSLPRR